MILDGQKLDVNVAFGTNFADGRGNVTAYFGYRDTKPILQADRDVSSCAADPAGFTAKGNTDLACGGSSNNPFGLFDPQTGPAPISAGSTTPRTAPAPGSRTMPASATIMRR